MWKFQTAYIVIAQAGMSVYVYSHANFFIFVYFATKLCFSSTPQIVSDTIGPEIESNL